MKKKLVIGIVAVSDDNIIARNDGSLPWEIPADLARFKKLTLGHSIIMGRKTYDAIGKSLYGRQNIVISRNRKLRIKDVDVCSSIVEALSSAESQTIFVIGGAEIFLLSEDILDKMYVTRVHTIVHEGIKMNLDLSKFKEQSRENEGSYTYIEMIKK